MFHSFSFFFSLEGIGDCNDRYNASKFEQFRKLTHVFAVPSRYRSLVIRSSGTSLASPLDSIPQNFQVEPIYAREKFMTCYLDVSYDITPLAGEPSIFRNPDVLVTDQISNCSTRYLRSANCYAAICKCEKKDQIFLLDRQRRDPKFLPSCEPNKRGLCLGHSMRSLFSGVYLCSHVAVFTFLEAVSDSGCFHFYKKEVHLDRDPLSKETPGYAKVFDTLPFIAQAKGYQVLSAILSALSLLGSFFTPLPWIALNLIARLLKNGFQRTIGLTRRTNGILHFLSTLIPVLRPLNTVTNKVSYIKFGVTFMSGGQSLPKGYTLVLSEIDTVSITVGQRLIYIFDNVRIEMEVTEIKENAVAVVDLVFTRVDEVHRYDKMCYDVEDLALMDVVLSNWMRCYEVPPLIRYKHIGGLYECTQPTTLFQVVGDGVRRKSYRLVHMHHSIVE